MFAPLTYAQISVLLGSACYAAWLTIRSRPIDNPMFYLACSAELLIIVQLIVGVLTLGRADSAMSSGVFIAYLLGMVAVLPIAAFMAFAERRSRWGTAVLLVGLVGLVEMVIRLQQLWTGQG